MKVKVNGCWHGRLRRTGERQRTEGDIDREEEEQLNGILVVRMGSDYFELSGNCH